MKLLAIRSTMTKGANAQVRVRIIKQAKDGKMIQDSRTFSKSVAQALLKGLKTLEAQGLLTEAETELNA